MSKTDHLAGYKFKPGQSGNPGGRPKGMLTRDQVEAAMGRISGMTVEEIKALVQDPKTKVLDIMVASVVMRAVENGDHARVDFLLNRTIGKVMDKVEVTMPQPFVVKRPSGESVEIGLKPPESPE